MKENRVTKQQAISLKKLGYDGDVRTWYCDSSAECFTSRGYTNFNKQSFQGDDVYSAPTISDAIQWMWDKFGVNIVVWQVDPNEWMYEKYYEDSGSLANGSFPTRPAAQSAGLDAAIQYKLKQIEQC